MTLSAKVTRALSRVERRSFTGPAHCSICAAGCERGEEMRNSRTAQRPSAAMSMWDQTEHLNPALVFAHRRAV